MGVQPEEIVTALTAWSKYAVPEHILVEIKDYAPRFGRLKISAGPQGLVLSTDDAPLAEEISRNRHKHFHWLHPKITGRDVRCNRAC